MEFTQITDFCDNFGLTDKTLETLLKEGIKSEEILLKLSEEAIHLLELPMGQEVALKEAVKYLRQNPKEYDYNALKKAAELEIQTHLHKRRREFEEEARQILEDSEETRGVILIQRKDVYYGDSFWTKVCDLPRQIACRLKAPKEEVAEEMCEDTLTEELDAGSITLERTAIRRKVKVDDDTVTTVQSEVKMVPKASSIVEFFVQCKEGLLIATDPDIFPGL